MTKWEYRQEYIDSAPLLDLLADLGLQGWEVCGYNFDISQNSFSETSIQHIFILKRPIEEPIEQFMPMDPGDM